MTEIGIKNDFKEYDCEFTLNGREKRYVVENIEQKDDEYIVDFADINSGHRDLHGWLPKECVPYVRKGVFAIFDGKMSHGANRAVTFYTPEGQLLGGYKSVDRNIEIITPNSKIDFEDYKKMIAINNNSDFNTYNSEFMLPGMDPKKYVVGRVTATGDFEYAVSFCDINSGRRDLHGWLPKECVPYVRKGVFAIFDGKMSHGANRAVTFYTPEGQLLGGYKSVDGNIEIITPNIENSSEYRREMFDKSNKLRQEQPFGQEVALTTMCKCYVAEEDKKIKLGFLKTLYHIRKEGITNQDKNRMADTFARVLKQTPELKDDDNLVRLSQRDTIIKQPTKAVKRQVEIDRR